MAFGSNFAHGISSLGLPVIPGVVNLPSVAGNAWFVDATNGATDYDGKSPERALATIQAAINKAAAGDTIFVYPGSYDETLSVTKDYLSLIGAVQGYGKPDLTGATTSAAALTVKAQGFVLKRFRVYSGGGLATANGVEAAGRLVRIKGNGFHIEDCVFDGENAINGGSATDNANSIGVSLKGDADDDSYTASEGRILRCYFRGFVGRPLAFETGEPVPNGVGSTDVEVLYNRFSSNTGIDIICRESVAGGGTYSVKRALIAHNWFMAAKNKTTWIDFTTSNDGAASDQDGSIMGNYFQDDALDATAVAIAGTGFSFVGNYDSVGVQDGSAFDD